MRHQERTGAFSLFRGSPQIATPILLLCLFGAAAASWFAVTETVAARPQEKQWQEAPPVPLEALPPENRPQLHTQDFLQAAVPLGADARTICLYVSPTTARYLASAGGNYDSVIKPWRQFFAQRRYQYIETTSIPEAEHAQKFVLILPSSLALDEQERQQLASFQRHGGSVLATSAAGARNANGTWHGYALLRDLFNVTVVGEVAPESDERFLNLLGETPLTMGYPAGRRIWLENTSERALRIDGGLAAAWYMNWTRTTEGSKSSAAVLFDEHGKDKHYARWAVFGFAETSWGTQSSELSGLLDNTLHWLSHGTAITKAAWPAPYRAAYLLEMDTEEGFANARQFAAMLEKHGLRGTFYSLTSEAVRYPYLVRELARHHEIGFHGDVHHGFRGQTAMEQGQRLQRMLADMKSIVGDNVETTGFRAPREEYDRITEQLLQDRGFLHHAADPNRTDARLPFIIQSGSDITQQGLVILPRTQDDDINHHMNELGAQMEKRLEAALNAQFEDVREMGSMGLLSIHSQYFASGSALRTAMPGFLQTVANNGKQVWVAPGQDIANWWRQRERIQYSVSGSSEQFRLEFTVTGHGPLGHAAMIVTHRQATSPVQFQQVQGPNISATVRMLDAHRSAIEFDRLAPGTYALLIRPTMHTAPAGSRTIDITQLAVK
jgi:hypothetical protein